MVNPRKDQKFPKEARLILMMKIWRLTRTSPMNLSKMMIQKRNRHISGEKPLLKKWLPLMDWKPRVVGSTALEATKKRLMRRHQLPRPQPPHHKEQSMPARAWIPIVFRTRLISKLVASMMTVERSALRRGPSPRSSKRSARGENFTMVLWFPTRPLARYNSKDGLLRMPLRRLMSPRNHWTTIFFSCDSARNLVSTSKPIEIVKLAFLDHSLRHRRTS